MNGLSHVKFLLLLPFVWYNTSCSKSTFKSFFEKIFGIRPSNRYFYEKMGEDDVN